MSSKFQLVQYVVIQVLVNASHHKHNTCCIRSHTGYLLLLGAVQNACFNWPARAISREKLLGVLHFWELRGDEIHRDFFLKCTYVKKQPSSRNQICLHIADLLKLNCFEASMEVLMTSLRGLWFSFIILCILLSIHFNGWFIHLFMLLVFYY